MGLFPVFCPGETNHVLFSLRETFKHVVTMEILVYTQLNCSSFSPSIKNGYPSSSVEAVLTETDTVFKVQKSCLNKAVNGTQNLAVSQRCNL